MKQIQFEILKKVQFNHWWYQGRSFVMKAVLEKFDINLNGKIIADLGCGYGVNYVFYKDHMKNTFFLDSNKEALKFIKNDLKADNIIFWKSPEPVEQKFDFIFMTDVLEHIDDDIKAVKWIYDHLKPGGKALLTMPAHQYLWTQMDSSVHHKRRYSYNQLRTIFNKFSITFISYYNFLLFPLKIIALMHDKIMTYFGFNTESFQTKTPIAFVNKTLKMISFVESKIIKKTTLPYGAGLIILLQKND